MQEQLRSQSAEFVQLKDVSRQCRNDEIGFWVPEWVWFGGWFDLFVAGPGFPLECLYETKLKLIVVNIHAVRLGVLEITYWKVAFNVFRDSFLVIQ
jgi:hypothetical protein